jgi:hypothetical protein
LLNGSVSTNQSGLAIGSSYFVDLDGNLTTTNTGTKAGRAIAADPLLVDSTLTGPEMNAYLGSLL